MFKSSRIKNAFKRILSGVMAATLCLGMIPVASADSSDIGTPTALTISTVDSPTRQPLGGVVVKIECTSAGQYKDYGEYTSESDGRVTIDQVPVGYYRITAVRAPQGYWVDPTPQLVYLDTDQGDAPVVTVTAYAQHPLVVRKVNPADGSGMSGAIFEVRNAKGAVVGTMTTDSNGYGRIPYIAPGEYTVTEIHTPEGQYAAEAQKVTVLDNPEGETMLIFYATEENVVVVRLTDRVTGEPLEGAEFQLKKGNAAIMSATTDSEGFAYFKNVTANIYTLTQVSFPDGYLSEVTSREVKVTTDEKVVTVPITNSRPGTLTVYSKDAAGQPLSGTVIQVYDSDNNKVGTSQETNSGGFVTFSGLEPGQYTVMATASEGYTLITSAKAVVIEKNEMSVVEFISMVRPSILITCFDDAGKAISGASFSLQKANTGVLGSYVTGTDGTVLIPGLEPGEYTITMTSVPAGYVISSMVQTRMITTGQTRVDFIVRTEPYLEIVHYVKNTTIPLAGGQFEIYKGNELITTKTTGADGRILIENLEPGEYTIRHTASPEKYTIDIPSQKVTIKPGGSGYALFTSTPMAAIAISKVDAETGEPLAGARFIITNSLGHEVASLVTDVAGFAQTDVLDNGVYYVKETVAPEGYQIDQQVRAVELQSGRIANLTISNTAKNAIYIHLDDEVTKDGLDGGMFLVRNEDGIVVGEGYTMNGLLVIPDLPVGDYLVSQVAAPQGYIRDMYTQSISVTTSANAHVFFLNREATGIVIEAVEAVNHAPVAGAVFEIYDDTGRIIFHGTTADDGILMTEELPSGKYTIKEVAVAEGYSIVTSTQTVTVNNTTPITAVFEHYPLTSLIIELIDGETGAHLSNATFKVQSVEGEFVTEVVTDAGGVATVPNLEPGYYLVTQMSVSSDEYIHEGTYQFAYISFGNDTKLTFVNNKYSGIIIESVIVNSHEPLGGTKFEVWTINEQTKVFEGTADSTGVLQTNVLDPGQYLVKQTATVDGYTIVTSTQVATVIENEPVTVVFENKPIGGLMIQKIDATTREPLAGAVFEVWNQNQTKLFGTYTSDVAGFAMVGQLATGTYVIKEVKAPDGYAINTPIRQVAVVSGEATTVIFENTRNSGLILEKVDANDPTKMLAGATFTVYDLYGSYMGEYVTNDSGIVIIDNLAPGQYRVVETKAPAGYQLDGSMRTVTVRAAYQSKLTFTNKALSGIVITKVDSSTNKPLAGAHFQISKLNGEIINTYVSDSTGTIQTGALEPGQYVIKEMQAPDGYVIDQATHTVTVEAGKTTTIQIGNSPMSALRIQKVDGTTGQPLSGARFKVTKTNGDYVGEYVSELDGIVNIPTMQPGTYVITETAAPEGYLVDPTPRTVTVKTGVPTVLTIENERVAGLQIRKTVTQTGDPLEGVQFKIKKEDGTLVGNYTTDKTGLIYVSLEPGNYVVQETYAPDGYQIDQTPHYVTVKTGEPTVLEIQNAKMSSVKIQKVDAETGLGIYGVVFEVKDSVNNYIGTYTTDDQGIIDLTAVLPEGKYIITEKQAAAGYVLDPIPRTVTVSSSEPTVIRWENSREKGQVKITKYSADDNAMMNIPANTPLAGAQFTITSMDGTVVGVVETNAIGVAFSPALDLGYYIVQETKAPTGYQINPKPVTISVTSKNQDINLAFYNNSANVGLTIEKHGEAQVRSGNTMKYYFTNIKNVSTSAVDNFYFSDKLPTDAVRAQTLYTGTWSSMVYYNIEYKTNMYDYRTLASNLNSQTQYSYDLSSTALNLESGEYVTDIRFAMGTVPAGFHEVVSPVLYAYVLPSVANNYQIINRCEVGAQVGGQWITNADQWTTIVQRVQVNLPDGLPTTGF